MARGCLAQGFVTFADVSGATFTADRGAEDATINRTTPIWVARDTARDKTPLTASQNQDRHAVWNCDVRPP